MKSVLPPTKVEEGPPIVQAVAPRSPVLSNVVELRDVTEALNSSKYKVLARTNEPIDLSVNLGAKPGEMCRIRRINRVRKEIEEKEELKAKVMAQARAASVFEKVSSNFVSIRSDLSIFMIF